MASPQSTTHDSETDTPPDRMPIWPDKFEEDNIDIALFLNSDRNPSTLWSDGEPVCPSDIPFNYAKDISTELVYEVYRRDEIGYSEAVRTLTICYRAHIEGAFDKTFIRHTVGGGVAAVTRNFGTPLPPGLIADILSIDKTEVKKMKRKIISYFDLDLNPPPLRVYINALAERVNASNRVVDYAISLVYEYEEDNKHVGKNRWGIAAAALYIVSEYVGNCRNRITQSELVDATHLTDSTIRSRRKELNECEVKGVFPECSDERCYVREENKIKTASANLLGALFPICYGDDWPQKDSTQKIVAHLIDVCISSEQLSLPYVPPKSECKFITTEENHKYSLEDSSYWVRTTEVDGQDVFVDVRDSEEVKIQKLKQFALHHGIDLTIPESGL